MAITHPSKAPGLGTSEVQPVQWPNDSEQRQCPITGRWLYLQEGSTPIPTTEPEDCSPSRPSGEPVDSPLSRLSVSPGTPTLYFCGGSPNPNSPTIPRADGPRKPQAQAESMLRAPDGDSAGDGRPYTPGSAPDSAATMSDGELRQQMGSRTATRTTQKSAPPKKGGIVPNPNDASVRLVEPPPSIVGDPGSAENPIEVDDSIVIGARALSDGHDDAIPTPELQGPRDIATDDDGERASTCEEDDTQPGPAHSPPAGPRTKIDTSATPSTSSLASPPTSPRHGNLTQGTPSHSEVEQTTASAADPPDGLTKTLPPCAEATVAADSNDDGLAEYKISAFSQVRLRDGYREVEVKWVHTWVRRQEWYANKALKEFRELSDEERKRAHPQRVVASAKVKDGAVWNILRVLGERKNGRRKEYRARWESTWVKAEALVKGREAFEEFWAAEMGSRGTKRAREEVGNGDEARTGGGKRPRASTKSAKPIALSSPRPRILPHPPPSTPLCRRRAAGLARVQIPSFRLPPGWSPSPPVEEKASMREVERLLKMPVKEHVDFIDSELRCPICSSVVDRETLDFHLPNERGTLDQKLDFCDLHRKPEAERDWQVRGYPKIDWAALEQRMVRFLQPLRNMLSRTAPSVCIQRLDSARREDRRHNILLGSAVRPSLALSSGYYGSRGAEAMGGFLVTHLAPDIMRFNIIDKDIGLELGLAGIIEAVLVPELTLLLIQEDLQFDATSALKVLQESKQIGELVHPVK